MTVGIEEAESLMKSWEGKLIPAARARALTNRFILDHLRDGFCAGTPRCLLVQKEPAWAVSILFARPAQPPHEVGEVLIHAIHADLLDYTPPAEVYRNAHATSGCQPSFQGSGRQLRARITRD